MIIKLETLLENGIIEPNKITEIVCENKTIFKGYSDDISKFGNKYELVKFRDNLEEGFNKPFYTIEVKAKNTINESFSSSLGINSKNDLNQAIKFYKYYDLDKQQVLSEEIEYLSEAFGDEYYDLLLDEEINNYKDYSEDILTEKLTKYNVDEKLNKKIDKTADKNYTSKATTAGGFIGWFYGGIIGIFIGRFVGHNIAASAKQDKIDRLYRYLKNDSELIGITNRMKSILNNDKLSKEDKDELKLLRKSFSSRLKVVKTNYREHPYGSKDWGEWKPSAEWKPGMGKPDIVYEDLNNDDLVKTSKEVLQEMPIVGGVVGAEGPAKGDKITEHIPKKIDKSNPAELNQKTDDEKGGIEFKQDTSLQEWFGRKKQEKETKSTDNIKDDVEKEPKNTKTVTIDRSQNEFGQWKSYDAYKANEKKDADEAHAGVLRNEKKKEEYFAKHPKAPDPNTYWDVKNKCLRDKDTNEVVKKTKYSPATLREDVEQIDEEVLDRILLERPLINTDKFDKDGNSQDIIDYPASRKIIYGKDEKTEKQLKKNVKKFNGKVVRNEPTSSLHTTPYTFYKKESAKDAPISNWKYVSDKEAEKYARKVFDNSNAAKRLEVDEDDVKRIANNDSARITNSKRDFSKDDPNTNKKYTDELEARLKKAKEDVAKEEKKDKK